MLLSLAYACLCCLIRATQSQHCDITVQTSGISLDETFDQYEELKIYLDVKESLGEDITLQRVALGRLIFDPKYSALLDEKNFVKNFDSLIQKQWETVRTIPTLAIFHETQMKALKQGKYDVVMYLKEQRQLWKGKVLESLGEDPKSNVWPASSISDTNMQLTASFMDSFRKRRDLHENIMQEVFIAFTTPESLAEAIAYAAKQVLHRISVDKILMNLFQSVKNAKH